LVQIEGDDIGLVECWHLSLRDVAEGFVK